MSRPGDCLAINPQPGSKAPHLCQCTKLPGHRGPHWCGWCGAQWHTREPEALNTRNRLEQA